QQRWNDGRVSVPKLVIQAVWDLQATCAQTQPIAEAVVQVKPIHLSVITSPGTEIVGKKLQPHPQRFREGLGEVDAYFGKLEAAVGSALEGVVIVHRQYEALTGEPVDFDISEPLACAEGSGLCRPREQRERTQRQHSDNARGALSDSSGHHH